MKPLVIEDDKDVRNYIARGMKESGHRIDLADNGKDGLFLATTETCDAIILGHGT